MEFLIYYSFIPLKLCIILLNLYHLKTLITQNLLVYTFHYESVHFQVWYLYEWYFFNINKLMSPAITKKHLKQASHIIYDMFVYQEMLLLIILTSI